mgnify:FL=1
MTEAATNEINLKEYLEKDVPWSKLPLTQKLKFFNFWFIVGIIGNTLQMIGSTSIMLTFNSDAGQDILTIDNVFIGFGCMFAWIQLMYYLKFNRSIILMTSTFSKSIVENLVFFGLVIPIFVGFAIVGKDILIIIFMILGQGFFWPYDKFQSTGSSMQSLFGLFCGDIVYETFTDTYDETVFKQVYLVIYLLAFYTSVQNIFVAIVMEGYDRCSLRKNIDNDDPFPSINSFIDKAKREQHSRSYEIVHDNTSNISQLEYEDDQAQSCNYF